MDNPVVSEPREAPPEWAQPSNAATDKQIQYIRTLQGSKEMTPEASKWLDERLSQFLSKSGASELIDRLLVLADRPGSVRHPGLPDVPAGRYAIEAENGELR